MAVGAAVPREEVRDVLVLPVGSPSTTSADPPPGTRVGTSAARQPALLRALHP
ncbi:hypothetical protein [Streptomyces chattanoogensis]|uniref:hypothetical protein n=1 Tax=Streptomyces chattanoogensis TaxID=66876 RepID=UPI00368F79B4